MSQKLEARRALRQKHKLNGLLAALEEKSRTLRRVATGELGLDRAAEEYLRQAQRVPEYDWAAFRARFPGSDDLQRFRAQVLDHLHKVGGHR